MCVVHACLPVCDVYTCVWIHVCVHVYTGSRLMLATFLYHPLPCVLSRDLSLNPKLPNFASLAGCLTLRLLSLPPMS